MILNRKRIGPLMKNHNFFSHAAHMNRWRVANIGRARSNWRKWRKDNPQYWIKSGNRYSRLKQTAKHRGIPVEITLDQYKLLTEDKPCHYCGADLADKAGWCLDRLDNAQGYIFDNCVPCCYWCNVMKFDKAVDEFFAHIKKILARASLLESTKEK